MSNNLQTILRAKGLTHAQVADALGVTRQAVQRWATKGNPRLEKLSKLADFLGVTPGQITGDEDYEAPTYVPATGMNAVPQQDGWTVVPVLDAYGSCGSGSPSVQANSVGAMQFSDDFLRSLPGVHGIRDGQFAIISASGDSMEPTITRGGLVLVDTHQTEARGDGIYVFVNGDDVFIKRVQINLNRSLTLISDNASYPPTTLSRDELDGAHIHGRVIFVFNGFRA